jgi:hypothetical protein
MSPLPCPPCLRCHRRLTSGGCPLTQNGVVFFAAPPRHFLPCPAAVESTNPTCSTVRYSSNDSIRFPRPRLGLLLAVACLVVVVPRQRLSTQIQYTVLMMRNSSRLLIIHDYCHKEKTFMKVHHTNKSLNRPLPAALIISLSHPDYHCALAVGIQ